MLACAFIHSAIKEPLYFAGPMTITGAKPGIKVEYLGEVQVPQDAIVHPQAWYRDDWITARPQWECDQRHILG
jgi:hypothetical protein